MPFNPDVHRRQSIRLRGYDYASPCACFVTIVTRHREHHFGYIRDDRMVFSDIGARANRCWLDIPMHYPHVAIDAFQIMPNHIHGIFFVTSRVGVDNYQPLRETRHRYQHVIGKSIASVIRGFKIGVTSWCNANGHSYFGWQRNYWERIIRSEPELNRTRQYIIDNPSQWDNDEFRIA